ncbi:MAG: M23 family metallopeptidase [Deltaproteobacteria bacterium]|nr:M23 family metallopeptidase [Deltaproteobacteria bacterium]
MNTPLIYYALSAVTVIIPFGASVILWRKNKKNLLDWGLSALCAGAAVLFAHFAGAWVFLTLYLRFISILFFVFALVKSYTGLKKRMIFSTGAKTGSVGINLRAAVILIFAVLNFFAIKGMFYKGDAVDLSFPLRGGTYSVVQGGSSQVTNFFHKQNPSETYALDIVKLGLSGRRAQGVYPERLSYFNIYGEQIFSPCSGRVIKAVDGVFDNPTGEVNAINPAGNHVIISCKGVNVIITHLANNSLYVKTGADVLTGQRLAIIGNSGDSLEPHLHIHAVKASSQAATAEGIAVPITFNGKFLTMNNVFTAE